MTQPEGMDLSRIVSDMSELLPQLIGPRVRLRLRASEPAWIHADPAQLEQVLLNLALNARDAMPDGGTLAVSCTHVAAQGRVVLEVSDDGTGMDEATQQQAFEPFFTTKPRSRGTGLGLSLVHGIVEASGGALELSSAPGRGTTFTLSWPEHRPEHRALPPAAGAPHLDAAHPCLAAADEERTPPPSSAVSLRAPRSTRNRADDQLEARLSPPVELEPASTRNREDEERRL
jgi:two-component system cell cycle sensor histidine kinase/response regulator CckA